jgi:MerR family copper efflux transcriptional regulator
MSKTGRMLSSHYPPLNGCLYRSILPPTVPWESTGLTFQFMEGLWYGRRRNPMNIGEVARRAGLNSRTIRFYESIGLVQPPDRASSGYRDYDDKDVHRLRFVASARALGFSVEEIRQLLALYDDRERSSSDVKQLVLQHVGEIDRKMKELAAMRRTLLHLSERCHGDERPDCPILDGLSAGKKT